eukprot:scaffold211455_cov35-Prasinocladus_malaysianus.AAC.2
MLSPPSPCRCMIYTFPPVDSPSPGAPTARTPSLLMSTDDPNRSLVAASSAVIRLAWPHAPPSYENT